MESELSYQAARALLEWHIELGATEAIGDLPVNRYEISAAALAPKPAPTPEAAAERATPPLPQAAPEVDPVDVARAAAAGAADLKALEAAMADYPHCDLKMGARNLVFFDGNPAARVMIIGEAPGRDEDMQGKPFVGRAGQLLDRMLAAIGMARHSQDPAKSVYITNVLPWRPPQNRDPKPEEIAMLLPFLQRHVELVDPELVVLMGNTSCQAGLGRRGITRLRGTWTQAYGRPAMPMFHPAGLLRNPHNKRFAWADLLEVQARLEGET